ncbi:cytochrome P450 [Cryphonectria parasitica EP155]|uniref:Cytochrome P450 n=1 Tax=Cryphonectria parasitica (strain ATCC 38755 / EP155) TaxID=660469 RepID=A0A9P4Y2M0_CRYP1|nr:cytochrome P450 [Cryphonectria parasitica EP155]KAF3765310.1 cytochrome P450 [Cryphonectria parasitica EP155]
MVKSKLTQSLSKLTDPLSEETASACNELFPATKEWHEMTLKDGLLDLVARLSARVFLGDEEITHNASWLGITKSYTVDSFLASHELRTYPRFLQTIIHWFLPRAQKVRAQLKEAESIIKPVMERRRAERASSTGLAEKSDTIEWTEQIARERKLQYYPAAFQLNLAVSAIHTTTDLLAHTVYCLLQNPEFIQPLRDEIISVVAEGGLKHASLYKLKLMDSVVKEAQRLKPPMSVNMNRVAMRDTRLPDGTLIPKGTKVGVSCQAMWDASVYPEPEKFDGYRFLRLREQPGNDNAWQLTTTRPEHIAFGHGKHACPGRFLAANEIKIVLCHMLLKYEWQLSASSPQPKIFTSGIMMDSDPTVKVSMRGRRAEVEL